GCSSSSSPSIPFSPQSLSVHPDLHSFPTRRSSDLVHPAGLYRRSRHRFRQHRHRAVAGRTAAAHPRTAAGAAALRRADRSRAGRSEEHTSELQSRENLVCRLLLEKKKIKKLYFLSS